MRIPDLNESSRRGNTIVKNFAGCDLKNCVLVNNHLGEKVNKLKLILLISIVLLVLNLITSGFIFYSFTVEAKSDNNFMEMFKELNTKTNANR